MKFKALIILLTISFLKLNAQNDLKNNFINPPFNYYPKPLYFFNNKAVDSIELAKQMTECKEKCHYSGFGIIPFGKKFEPKYLSNEYFALYGSALRKANELEMQMILYDEYGFPSGSAGAINGDEIPRFKLRFPDQTIKRLDKKEYIVTKEKDFSLILPSSKIMAVIAFDTISLQRINLRPSIRNNKLQWEVPAGNWKVMVFTCVVDGDPNVDYLDPAAVRHFIEMTHQAYYDRFKNYFGKTVIGTFFDEPTLYRAQGRIWTDNFNEKFKQKYGVDPDIYYPALWYNIGEETAEARNYLFGFRSELYAQAFMKELSDWSKDHGVYATGHQDNEEIVNPVSTSGDFMLWTKYLDIPGVDKIGGDRPTEKFYKLISSAAYNWDKNLVMSETYGAMGNISWETMYKVAMEQFAKGINNLIPHAVWYDTSNVVFKPELSYRNKLYADSLPIFNQYLARMHYMMQNKGYPVCDIAVLYPIQTLQDGHYLDGPLGSYRGGVEIPNTDYVNIGELLTNTCGRDYMFLHPEVLDERCIIKNKILSLNNKNFQNDFKVLILPSCKILSPSNLKQLKSFYESGGILIFTTQLPSKSTLHEHDKEVVEFMQTIFRNQNSASPIYEANNGNAFFIKSPDALNLNETLEKALKNFDIGIYPVNGIPYIHKVYKGIDIIYMCNLNTNSSTIKINIKGKKDFELWSPHTGEIREIEENYVKQDNDIFTVIDIPMQKLSSVFLIKK